MTKDLPDGYIGRDAETSMYAVDSKTISQNGQVHLHRGDTLNNNYIALDAEVELDITGDPRLERLKKYARELRNHPGVTGIKDQREREAFITKKLMQGVKYLYGEYSQQTVANVYNSEEEQAIKEGRPARLANMPSGSLVCRHFAPIMSVCLEEAGIPNHMIVNSADFNPDSQANQAGYHAFIVTRDTGAIVEATALEENATPYLVPSEKVVAEDIVRSGSIVEVYNGEQKYSYGGYYSYGNFDSSQAKTDMDRARQRAKEEHYEALLKEYDIDKYHEHMELKRQEQARRRAQEDQAILERYAPDGYWEREEDRKKANEAKDQGKVHYSKEVVRLGKRVIANIQDAEARNAFLTALDEMDGKSDGHINEAIIKDIVKRSASLNKAIQDANLFDIGVLAKEYEQAFVAPQSDLPQLKQTTNTRNVQK